MNDTETTKIIISSSPDEGLRDTFRGLVEQLHDEGFIATQVRKLPKPGSNAKTIEEQRAYLQQFHDKLVDPVVGYADTDLAGRFIEAWADWMEGAGAETKWPDGPVVWCLEVGASGLDDTQLVRVLRAWAARVDASDLDQVRRFMEAAVRPGLDEALAALEVRARTVIVADGDLFEGPGFDLALRAADRRQSLADSSEVSPARVHQLPQQLSDDQRRAG